MAFGHKHQYNFWCSLFANVISSLLVMVLCTKSVFTYLGILGKWYCIEFCPELWESFWAMPKSTKNWANLPVPVSKRSFSPCVSWLWIVSTSSSSVTFFISLNNSAETEYGACGTTDDFKGAKSFFSCNAWAMIGSAGLLKLSNSIKVW